MKCLITRQHSGQFLIANGRMRVSDLFHSDLVNEKSRVAALTQKSVRTIDKSDYEVPGVEFLFGGYCWHTKEFKLWKFVYQKDIKKFTHHTVKFWRGVKSSIKVVFSGDYLDEAKDRLVNLLKERGKLGNGCLEMEPLEVIRDMLLDSNADTKFHLIGGPPQMVKVYKSLNRVPFGIKWKIDGEEVVTLFGKPVKSFRNMPLPIVNPITLEYSNTNVYS